MGLLSKASTLDTVTEKKGLAFSDFINKHSIKKAALLERTAADYFVTSSVGFDALSIISATSTADFWEGICKTSGSIYNFSDSENKSLLQLFSFNLKDSIKELSVYKNSSAQILLCQGKLSVQAAKDFENITNQPHENNVQTLNPLLKGGSTFLFFKLDFEKAVQDFYNSECKNNIPAFDIFQKAVANEIYNRFACNYSISDTTIINNSHSIKTVIVTGKAYSIDLITHHLILNLKEVLNNSAELIQIDYCDTADSCEKIESFLQAE